MSTINDWIYHLDWKLVYMVPNKHIYCTILILTNLPIPTLHFGKKRNFRTLWTTIVIYRLIAWAIVCIISLPSTGYIIDRFKKYRTVAQSLKINRLPDYGKQYTYAHYLSPFKVESKFSMRTGKHCAGTLKLVRHV